MTYDSTLFFFNDTTTTEINTKVIDSMPIK